MNFCSIQTLFSVCKGTNFVWHNQKNIRILSKSTINVAEMHGMQKYIHPIAI